MILYESRQLISWLRVLSPCLLIVLLTGCHGVETEEAEHHAPAHMPADYPAAVDRLLALHSEIAKGSLRAADEIDVFAETHDIVRWLPMLAADSDLEEPPWNRVHAAARRLEKILTHVLSLGAEKRKETYFQYETELDQHQRTLVEIKQQFPAASALASDQST